MAVMLPAGRLSGALEQAREHGEDARRVAAAGRRLAGGEAHLALGAGEARDRVDQKKHARALVAEVLGVRRRHLRGAQPLERGHVARGDDHDALLAALGARASARGTRPPRGPARRRAPRRRRRPRRPRAMAPSSVLLPTPGAGEQAHALPLAEREQPVEDAHAGREAAWPPGAASSAAGRVAVDGHELPVDRWPAVERPPQARRPRARAAPGRRGPAGARRWPRLRRPARRRQGPQRHRDGLALRRSRPPRRRAARPGASP